MIDRLYKTVQAIANKEQLGYIKPYKFNLYAYNSSINIFSKLLADVKTQVRKSNWMLDGRNIADYSEMHKQLLEHFLSSATISKNNDNFFDIPENCEFIQDLYTKEGNRVDKLDLQDFNLIRRNNYAKPSNCKPVYHKEGSLIKVLPSFDELDISYIRTPKVPKWTFEEDTQTQKPMFDPTKDDYQDIDMPVTLFNELVVDILAQIGVTIRDVNLINYSNQEESKEMQTENRQ